MSETKHSSTDTQRLVVSWTIQGALCGLDTDPVQEIVRVGHITPVHQAPVYVLGIMNLRGRIVTVIDLGIILDLGHTEIIEDSRILIVDWHGEQVGLLVERNSGVVAIQSSQMRPPPENVRGVQGSMLEGVCLVDGHLIGILNLASILTEVTSDKN